VKSTQLREFEALVANEEKVNALNWPAARKDIPVFKHADGSGCATDSERVRGRRLAHPNKSFRNSPKKAYQSKFDLVTGKYSSCA